MTAHPHTALSDEAIAQLAQGSPLEQIAAKAVTKDKPELIMKAIRKHWATRRIYPDVKRFVYDALRVDHFEGPLGLRGSAHALAGPWSAEEMLGEEPPGLDGKPLPWLRIGSSRYFGDLYLSLPDGKVGCFPPEVLPELWFGANAYVQESYQRFHEELFWSSGWYNDVDMLLTFQAACARRGIDTEDFDDHLEALAEVSAPLFKSGANIERYLSNRWFNFSRRQLNQIKKLARPTLARLKAKR